MHVMDFCLQLVFVAWLLLGKTPPGYAEYEIFYYSVFNGIYFT